MVYDERMSPYHRHSVAFRSLQIVPLALLALMTAARSDAGGARGNFDQPPYYDGKPKGALKPAAHVTVTFRSGDPSSLDPTPDRSPALAAVLDSLRQEIGRLGLTSALAVDPRLQGGPDVAFGCRRGGTTEDGFPRPPDEIDTSEPRRMAFEVEDPKKSWREAVRAAAGDSVRSILCLQLGFGEYWVRQKNWKGDKVIDLGSGRGMPLRWLTSLDDPVQVLQLTAALVSPEGRVLRVGAEGLTARRTGMGASVLGAQEVLTEADLQSLNEPAADKPDPVWRSALRELVARMLEAQ